MSTTPPHPPNLATVLTFRHGQFLPRPWNPGPVSGVFWVKTWTVRSIDSTTKLGLWGAWTLSSICNSLHPIAAWRACSVQPAFLTLSNSTYYKLTRFKGQNCSCSCNLMQFIHCGPTHFLWLNCFSWPMGDLANPGNQRCRQPQPRWLLKYFTKSLQCHFILSIVDGLVSSQCIRFRDCHGPDLTGVWTQRSCRNIAAAVCGWKKGFIF